MPFGRMEDLNSHQVRKIATTKPQTPSTDTESVSALNIVTTSRSQRDTEQLRIANTI
jgi:hypothetical protein